MKWILPLLLLFTASCALLKGYKKDDFYYTTSPQQDQRLPLLIPRGALKEEIKQEPDGSKVQTYHYGNGTVLYIAYNTDTTWQYQLIAEEKNIPELHPLGGLMYKGITEDRRYWREIRIDSLRMGYVNVPYDLEIRFDSALNYASRRIPALIPSGRL
jgi:hypothetical protein